MGDQVKQKWGKGPLKRINQEKGGIDMWDAAGIGIIIGYGGLWLLTHPWPYLAIFITIMVLGMWSAPRTKSEREGAMISYEDGKWFVAFSTAVVAGLITFLVWAMLMLMP